MNKFLGVFVILNCVAILVSAQVVSTEFSRINVAYISMKNPITIVVEGVPCQEIYATTNNGQLKKYSNCSFGYVPSKVGQGSIFIYRKTGSDSVSIKEQLVRIKRIPDQKAYIGRINKGSMPIGELRAQNGVSVPIESFDIDANLNVRSYRLSLFRRGEMMATCINEGNRFGSAAHTILDIAAVGDKVLIEEIFIQYPGERVARMSEDIIVTIK